MEDLNEVDHCCELADDILSRVAEPLEVRDHILQVGASLGIACYPEDSIDAAELLKLADNAMYNAKMEGKNRYCRHGRGPRNSLA